MLDQIDGGALATLLLVLGGCVVFCLIVDVIFQAIAPK